VRAPAGGARRVALAAGVLHGTTSFKIILVARRGHNPPSPPPPPPPTEFEDWSILALFAPASNYWRIVGAAFTRGWYFLGFLPYGSLHKSSVPTGPRSAPAASCFLPPSEMMPRCECGTFRQVGRYIPRPDQFRGYRARFSDARHARKMKRPSFPSRFSSGVPEDSGFCEPVRAMF